MERIKQFIPSVISTARKTMIVGLGLCYLKLSNICSINAVQKVIQIVLKWSQLEQSVSVKMLRTKDPRLMWTSDTHKLITEATG